MKISFSDINQKSSTLDIMETIPWQAVDSSSKRALLTLECMSVPLRDFLLISGGGQRSGVAIASL